MKQALFERLFKLLCVRNIVTLVVIAVFAYLAITGGVSPEVAMTVVVTVIAFYFDPKE